jgi:catechol 2,3-dioxygenase-like lactoylglutathione lyase family enzyme
MEVTMSSTHTVTEHGTPVPTAAPVDLKLEVVPLPVADVDRAKRFYEGLGWRLDADFASGDEWRVVQLTPPGSPCSVSFGKGYTTAVPGSAQGTFLVVGDIEAARRELVAHGVDVSDVFHFDGNLLHVTGTKGRLPGPDPKGSSYFSFASFSDPDGNSWLLQEVKTRFPGRGLSSDIATVTELLREAEERHGEYERTAPKHHWSEWYGGYIVARQRGKTPDEATADAARQLDRTAERVQA